MNPTAQGAGGDSSLPPVEHSSVMAPHSAAGCSTLPPAPGGVCGLFQDGEWEVAGKYVI